MVLLEKWIELLALMYKKYEIFGGSGWISFKTQHVYKSRKFYKIINQLIKLGWVKEKINENGIIMFHEYSLTGNGFNAVHSGIIDIFLLEKVRKSALK
jgi:hypothetical protein